MGSSKGNNLSRTLAGIKRKSTLCNIWINLGFQSPYQEKPNKIARKIAVALSIDLASEDPAGYVISWVTENRPDLLVTARMRRQRLQKAVSQPEASNQDERNAFYDTWAWRRVRMEALKIHGRACQCCGATPSDRTLSGDPVRIVVDHVKPLSKYWNLRLDLENLQVLCHDCNVGKGAWDETDYR